MKKYLLPILVGAFLLGQTVASKAVSFTITVSGGNWLGGIISDNGFYKNTLLGFASGVGATSALSFGKTITNELTEPVIRPSSDTFKNKSVSFEFDVKEVGSGITHRYVVDGTFVGISGSATPKMTVNASGFGESKAAFRADQVTIDGSTVFNTVVNSPLLIPSIKTTIFFGSIPVDLYVDRLDQLTAPGDFSTELSVGGFIQAGSAVPEPGVLALLIGSGVGGSLFFLRRRRK
jgi:hypothetical protein